jgi:hypothetical protein
MGVLFSFEPSKILTLRCALPENYITNSGLTHFKAGVNVVGDPVKKRDLFGLDPRVPTGIGLYHLGRGTKRNEYLYKSSQNCHTPEGHRDGASGSEESPLLKHETLRSQRTLTTQSVISYLLEMIKAVFPTHYEVLENSVKKSEIH